MADFLLDSEESWPDNGEIDILEGINTRSVAKTALHTSDQCSMYAHVPSYAKTGHWDNATGIPDTFTSELNTFNRVEADNCWLIAPHQVIYGRMFHLTSFSFLDCFNSSVGKSGIRCG